MISQKTQKEYPILDLICIDSITLRVQSQAGTWYEELSDGTWRSHDDASKAHVRYGSDQSHSGGMRLRPQYELVGSTWYCMRTGKVVPDAAPKGLQRRSV